ncbi:hypothetical protein HK104_002404 [Borealophlyctis nickersoniae]|nr:hypothetical protein HK104_002404 [Borealophlyctis nickersoniae]
MKTGISGILPFTNLNDILRDSYSPALVFPRADSNTNASPYKIYYSHLRRLIASLQFQAPFTHLVPGDAITFLIPNCLDFVAVFFATTGARAIAHPLNPESTLDEIVFYLNDVKPRAVVVLRGHANVATVQQAAGTVGIPVFEISTDIGTGFKDRRHKVQQRGNTHESDVLVVDPVISVRPLGKVSSEWNRKTRVGPNKAKASVTDVALMFHTSGSFTDKANQPKGVPLSHGMILRSLRNMVKTYALTAADATYLVMPLFHDHGLIGVLLSTLRSGGTVIVPPKFSVTRFWRDFVEHDATWYSAVPAMHQMLLLKAQETHRGNSGKLRFIRSSTAPLSPTVLLQLEVFFKAPVIEAYAMSEAAHQITANFLPPGMRKPGSVGKGRGVQVVVVDQERKPAKTREVGEIWVRGSNVIKAYHNNPKATAEAFVPVGSSDLKWFRTGDLGFLDSMGFLYLTGRIEGQINRGGAKVSPGEVDQAILHHPGVSEASTFGVPSDMYGQEIEAAVVLKADAKGNVTEKDLIEHCKKRLAPFKVPRKIHIGDKLPQVQAASGWNDVKAKL